MKTPVPAQTDESVPRRSRGTQRWRVAALVASAAMLLAVVGAVVVLPRFLEARVVAAARSAGVHMTIERVEVGLSGVAFEGVSADIPTVPGVRARASRIVPHGLYATRIEIQGGDLDLEGSGALVDQLRAMSEGQSHEPKDLRRRTIEISSARIAWRGLFGKDSVIESGGVTATFDVVGNSLASMKANVGRFDGKASGKSFGPWSCNLKAAGPRADFALLLDPEDVEGPRAEGRVDEGRLSTLRLTIAETPFAKLGVQLADLGPAFDASSTLRADVEITRSADSHLDAKAAIDVHRVHAKGISTPIDVVLSAAASGTIGEALVLRNTSVGFGPFHAKVAGTVTPRTNGLRIDTSYDVDPISCADLVRKEAEKMGKFASLVQDIAQSSGMAKVLGHVEASGRFEFDSADPASTLFTVKADNACSFSLFGN